MSDSVPPPIPVAPGSDGPPPIPTGAPPVPPGASPIPSGAPAVPVAAPAEFAPGYGGAPAAMPAYGEAPVVRLAHPGWRALAFVIDGFGTFALTTVIVLAGLASGQWWTFAAIPIVPVGSFLLATILTATIGVSPGKAMVGIRVIHAATGGRIGAWSIIRSFVIVAPLLLSYFGLAIVSQFWDDSGIAFSFATATYLLPAVGWIVMFVLVCVRPQHRGIEDILARSVVVRSR